MTEGADTHDAPIDERHERSRSGWVLGPAGALIAVALGLSISLWAAAAAGLPGGDTVQLVALSFGVASAIYLVGAVAIRRAHSPLIVAVIPVASVVLGALAAARAMFVSIHDLSALVVVVAGAGTAGVLGALRLARELAHAQASRSRRRPVNARSSAAGASWCPGSATTCERRSRASGPWSKPSTTA